MWTEFWTYAGGFLSLVIYWILHHYVFNFIKRSDGLLVWLNLTFLALASLIPFWTQVLNYNDIGLVTLYYSFYMIVTFLVLLSILYYATIGNRLVDRNIDKHNVSVLKRILIVGSFIVAVVAIVIYLGHAAFPTWIGYLFLVPGAFFVIATISVSWRPKKAKTIK
jgi:uncharacterized membrane protein